MTARMLLHAWRVSVVAITLLIGGLQRSAHAAPYTQDDAIPLGYGQTVEGEITPDRPAQNYVFDAAANDVVTLAMNAAGGDLDPFITLFDTQNVQLATDDNSGGGVDARLAFVIPSNGRYFAQVTHAGGIMPVSGGRYTLTLTAVGEDGIVVERTPLPQPTPTPESVDSVPTTGDTQGLATRLRAIEPDAPIEDELTRQVAFHLYWFRANARDQVTIRAAGTDDFAPLVTLYDDAFGEIGRTQPSEPTLPAVLGDAGVYLIGVALPDPGSTGGAYTLELTSAGMSEVDTAGGSETEPTPTLPEEFRDLTAIEFDQTVEGTLDNQRFMDVYTFLGMAGQTITIDMRGTNPDAINALDPFLVLLDSASIPLAEHDDIVDGVERDARIEYTLPRTAYYAIVATRFDREAGTSAGPYELTLRAESGEGAEAPAPLESESIQPNTPIQATFDHAPDVYRFQAQAGELIDLSVTADPGVDPVLILATDTLREVVSSGTGALTGLRTPAGGAYYLIVATRFGPAGPTGGYIVALNQPDSPAAAQQTEESDDPAAPPADDSTVLYGEAVSGVIDDETPGRIYILNGAAGDNVRLSLRAAGNSTLDPYLEVRDADGVILANNDDIDPGVIRDSLLVLTLPADGEYQVIVSRYIGPDTDVTSGAYELLVEQITAEEAAPTATASFPEASGDTESETVPSAANTSLTPLRYGQTQVGEITDDDYLLFFVFSGEAGDVVTLEVDQLSGNLDAVMHLYQASGSQWVQIAYNDDSPNGGTYDPLLSDITLPASGSYLVAVGRYGLDQESGMTGTFAITLTRQP